MAALAVATCPALADEFKPDAIEAILKSAGTSKAEAPSAATDIPKVEHIGEKPAATAPETRMAEPEAVKPAPEDLYLSKDPQPTFTAATVELTEEAARKYLGIVEAGGWPSVPPEKLIPGVSSPAVAILKRRLIITGDLDVSAEPGNEYDATVETAVKHYQDRLGLEQTGAIGGQTLRALNVPAIVRYNQLLASAKRLRATKFAFGPRYVTVNIPSANVEAIEDGRVVRRYIAVAGKPDHPSPTVEAKITSINLNPTWTVPASIVKNEIIPHMQANPGYLAKEHIRILDQTGAEVNPAAINWATNSAAAFTLRQDSGLNNSLGTLRIDMPNKEAVYMHDTPSKGLFSASVRFGSHGCVRVSKVQDLAAWLLENNASSADQSALNQSGTGQYGPGQSAPAQSSWSAEMIAAATAIGTRLDVKLTKPVPVAWVYLTGYATPDHIVHFRNDVYNLDNGADVTAAIPAPHPQQQSSAAPAKSVTPGAAPVSMGIE